MRIHADSCGFMWIHVDFKDSHNDGAGIRGGSIVESVCWLHGEVAAHLLRWCLLEMVSSWRWPSAPVGGSWKTLPISDVPSVAVVSVPASVADGCPRSLSECRQGLRMAPHDDDGDDGSGIRGGSIVESVCWPRGDGVFLTSYVSHTLFLLLFLSILSKIFDWGRVCRMPPPPPFGRVGKGNGLTCAHVRVISL